MTGSNRKAHSAQKASITDRDNQSLKVSVLMRSSVSASSREMDS
jgi:hypothetical protein